MKRGKPLKRSYGLKRTELKVDAEKVREWREGTREAARERLCAKDRREQDRVREAARYRAEARRVPGERPEKPTKRDIATPRQRLRGVNFKAAVPANRFTCGRCRGRRADEWHHWLPQQQIRSYAHGLLRDLGIDRVIGVLRRLLADERNLIALCRVCHEDHEHTSRKMCAEDVPSSAHEFAAELGPEWSERLRRLYPNRPAVAGHDPRGS